MKNLAYILSISSRVGFSILRSCSRLLAADSRKASDVETGINTRDSGDVFGTFNYRTGRFDSGDEPNGWYRND